MCGVVYSEILRDKGSKGAPVPIPRHTCRDLGLFLEPGAVLENRRGSSRTCGYCLRAANLCIVTGRLAVRAAPPGLELAVAVGASAAQAATRVVVCILV